MVSVIDDICCVCRDNLAGDRAILYATTLSPIDERVVALACKHQFHLKCISRWFSQRNTCPMCNVVVLSVDNQSSMQAKILHLFHAYREFPLYSKSILLPLGAFAITALSVGLLSLSALIFSRASFLLLLKSNDESVTYSMVFHNYEVACFAFVGSIVVEISAIALSIFLLIDLTMIQPFESFTGITIMPTISLPPSFVSHTAWLIHECTDVFNFD
ncbi:MAG: RING finger domain-containing protein [Simkaniaceae bacterium]|nr:RING finger domain-containing protein [Simkaniaceae bacterium]